MRRFAARGAPQFAAAICVAVEASGAKETDSVAASPTLTLAAMTLADHDKRGARLAVGVTCVLLVLLLAVWYGVWPPRSLSSYRQQAASTVQSWRSQLDSTRLWVGAVEQGRVTKTAAAVAFREAEADSAATLDRFRSYEPPEPVSEALGLRTRVMAVGQQALSLLGNLRINANAGRWNEVTLAAPAMEDISGALQRLQTELST